jgi:hypothetical protein
MLPRLAALALLFPDARISHGMALGVHTGF